MTGATPDRPEVDVPTEQQDGVQAHMVVHQAAASTTLRGSGSPHGAVHGVGKPH